MTKLSEKVKPLKQSGIRAASVRCAQVNGINLGQGVCDLPIPESIKQEAYHVIKSDKSMYSACEGIFSLRQKVATKIQMFNHININPETELLITHGSTGANDGKHLIRLCYALQHDKVAQH